MNILAIETSCDETAIAIINTKEDFLHSENPQFKVLSDEVISQIDIHAEYGGVFPAMAKREHAKNLVPLLEHSLRQAQLWKERDSTTSLPHELRDILHREPELADALEKLHQHIDTPAINMIMVTHGPGLAPALWVGVNFARALAKLWNIPIIPVNHMEGHISSILLKPEYKNENQALLPVSQTNFPIIALLISGGHTQLVLVKDWCKYEIIGETIDDAVGEAFDKVARMLGMPYPGGPKISTAAKKGQENESINLPRPMIHSGDYRFSFSGLKTAARYLIQDLEKNNQLNDQSISDIAREFEHAVTDVLIKKTSAAIQEHSAQGLIVAGGVSANIHITNHLKQLTNEFDIPLYLPERNLCGDNALMIASAGFIQYWKKQKTATISPSEIAAVANLKL